MSDIKLDIDRLKRRGYSEAVFCECKSIEQLEEIFSTFEHNGQNVIGTRASIEQYQKLKIKFPKLKYNERARVIILEKTKIEKIGEVAVCTAGT